MQRSATPILPGKGRPEPPPELSIRERKIWEDCVSARPLNWFDGGTLPLLSAYCLCAVMTRDLAADLRKHSTAERRAEYRKQTATLGMLASKLRLAKLQQRKGHQHTDADRIAKTP